MRLTPMQAHRLGDGLALVETPISFVADRGGWARAARTSEIILGLQVILMKRERLRHYGEQPARMHEGFWGKTMPPAMHNRLGRNCTVVME